MRKKRKQLIFKVLILCMTIFLFKSDAFSVILTNRGGDAYEDDGGGKSNCMDIKENSIIEDYIEEGGGYFLNTYSNIMSISNRIETANLQGIDYEELKKILDIALINIKNARTTYALLIQTALNTPYYQEVISKLENFHYHSFMTDRSLNSVIFMEVEGYLKNGNITGTFIRIHSSFLKIEELLLLIKDELSLNKMPELSKIWEVNEEASRTLIFGQYITRIFYAIKY
jgi:hypothetical protein